MSDTQHTHPDDLTALPPEGRAARYRELASMHIRLAQRPVSPDAQASHLELAALWTRLAAQADHQPRETPSGLIGPDNLGGTSGEP